MEEEDEEDDDYEIPAPPIDQNDDDFDPRYIGDSDSSSSGSSLDLDNESDSVVDESDMNNEEIIEGRRGRRAGGRTRRRRSGLRSGNNYEDDDYNDSEEGGARTRSRSTNNNNHNNNNRNRSVSRINRYYDDEEEDSLLDNEAELLDNDGYLTEEFEREDNEEDQSDSDNYSVESDKEIEKEISQRQWDITEGYKNRENEIPIDDKFDMSKSINDLSETDRKSLKCELCQTSSNNNKYQFIPHPLIYDKHPVYIHEICAKYSPEVEFINNNNESIQSKYITANIYRGLKLLCSICSEDGGTCGCNVDSCDKSVHIPCAIKSGWKPGTKFYCSEHKYIAKIPNIEDSG